MSLKKKRGGGGVHVDMKFSVHDAFHLDWKAKYSKSLLEPKIKTNKQKSPNVTYACNRGNGLFKFIFS